MQSSQKAVKFSEKTDFFEISQQAWTPQLEEVQHVYRNPSERSVMCVAPPSTLSRPNYEGTKDSSTSFRQLLSDFYVRSVSRYSSSC